MPEQGESVETCSASYAEPTNAGAEVPAAGPAASAPPAPAGVPRWLRNTGVGSWSLIGLALVIVGVVYATSRISPVFIAVFAAFLLTALLNPIVNWLSKYIARGFAVVLSLIGAFAFVSGLLVFVVTSVTGQWQKLLHQLSNGIDQIVDFLNGRPFQLTLTSEEVYKWLSDMIAEAQSYATHNWQKLASTVVSNAGGIAIFFTILALSIFVTVFFLLQGSQMWRWFLNMLPTRSRGTWNHAAQAGWWSFSGYARGTMIIAFTDGVLSWIFLEVLRVPLAPALAVLIMIGALIPMIGAPLAMTLAMIVALATDGVWTALIVGLGIAGIGQLEGHILQPLIMGKQVSLSPVVVGIGVVSGTLLGGLLGAIIAIPIIGVSWAVFNALYHRDPPIQGPLPDLSPPLPPEKAKEPGFFSRLFHRKSEKDSTTNDSDSVVTGPAAATEAA